jgi:hypothetical protein
MENHGDDGDAGWGNVTRPPELSGNPIRRYTWELVGRMDKGVRYFCIFSI